MLKLNNIIKENILSFYDEYIITSFLKTIYIKKINFNCKKIVNKFKIKKNICKKFLFSNFKYKIKFGYYLDNNYLIYLPNNLTGIKKKILQKKICLFEILFKIIFYNSNKFATRKINFKKKNKSLKIKINKIYLGIIKNVVPYGIFIDLGKIDGLLHFSDIPKYKKIYKNLFTKNIILVKIIKFDKKFKKVSLNLKKVYKHFNFLIEEYIYCKIKKIEKKFIICLINNYKICIKKLNFYKKNDILKFYFIKKNEKFFFLSKYHKIYKNKNKFIKYNLKLKFNEFYLFSYKSNKIISFKNNKTTKLKKNDFYKYFISKIINNEFYKIISINKKNYIKFGNFYLLININFIFIIKKFKIYNNNIFFFLNKY
ncbi:S1 RNA-binding domain-containing protein [Candidatus Carsonella ruddii]|uniref:Putative ribosomal protein S1 n=1 Tax=Candidatus Carsonella ruddii PC isolate NHV TaxID=1202540 RepID=J3TEN8_CARRU|nr:S1 RNA-binding domain-containing protein [Candidatus Carsonella ruddii]AFP84277.1 putative ribosomal protein S1 [Candidatus Carsonella ruddii PC isolate NHV]